VNNLEKLKQEKERSKLLKKERNDVSTVTFSRKIRDIAREKANIKGISLRDYIEDLILGVDD